MCVIQIGELAGNISDDFRETHENSLEAITRTSQYLCTYLQGLAWSTFFDDLPQIKEECMKLLCE